jgi:putative spermidine/putrescine transport system substrate-binding protein
MAVGYSSKFGTITSLSQLLGPKFKNAVALNGNPTSANAALNGVMMANLAEGGTASNIADGVAFFHKLKAAGNFCRYRPPAPRSRRAPPRSCSTGTTSTCRATWAVSNWKVFIPSNAVLGGYYAQAINKNAPHPAAARLWEEFLYSQAATAARTSGSRAAPGRWSRWP